MTNYFMVTLGGRDLVDNQLVVSADGSPKTTTPGSTTGAPADLASSGRYLWGDDAADSRNAAQSVPWPSGFNRSVYRAARDPAIATDTTTANNYYNHGWLLAERLGAYFQDTRYGDHPTQPRLTWPPQEELGVVQITGTPAVSSGKGWHGFTSISWSGSFVAPVGDIRQLISGDEGSTKQVANILDMLHGLMTAGQINAIGDAYTANKAAIQDASRYLFGDQSVPGAAGTPFTKGLDGSGKPIFGGGDEGWPWTSLTNAQNQFWGRVGLNCRLGIAARFLDPVADVNSPIFQGIVAGLQAITAKECGLIGTTFTTARYETMTDPLDNVLAMPSGY